MGKDISWIKKTVQKAKRALRKNKEVEGDKKAIKGHLDAAIDRLDAAQNAAPTSPISATWKDLPNTLIGWASDNKRWRGGHDYAEVVLPAKGFRSQDGVNIKYKLAGFPTKHAELSYELFVDADWDPVKGGKLPGLFIGRGTGGKAYEKNDGSYRIMFRRGGQLVGYLYPTTDQGDIKKNQGRKFLDACANEFPEAGIDLWRKSKQTVALKKGQWNKVCMGLTLNDPKTSNGSIWLEVNGVMLLVDDARITEESDKNRIGGVQWSLWYGGSDASWSPKRDQTFKFRNIKYRVA